MLITALTDVFQCTLFEKCNQFDHLERNVNREPNGHSEYEFPTMGHCPHDDSLTQHEGSDGEGRDMSFSKQKWTVNIWFWPNVDV